MKIKKWAMFLFSVLLLVTLLCSCSEKYTSEELISAAIPLVEASGEINEIFYGAGIPFIESVEGETQVLGNYRRADAEYLGKIGVETIDDLKEMTSNVYSTGACGVIFSTKLSSVSDGSTIAGYAEYTTLGDAGLCVYTKRQDYINAKTEFHTDTLSVVSVKKDRATLKMEVTLYRDNDSQKREKEFAMIIEDGEWRLDSMTYIAWDSEFVTE